MKKANVLINLIENNDLEKSVGISTDLFRKQVNSILDVKYLDDPISARIYFDDSLGKYSQTLIWTIRFGVSTLEENDPTKRLKVANSLLLSGQIFLTDQFGNDLTSFETKPSGSYQFDDNGLKYTTLIGNSPLEVIKKLMIWLKQNKEIIVSTKK